MPKVPKKSKRFVETKAVLKDLTIVFGFVIALIFLIIFVDFYIDLRHQTKSYLGREYNWSTVVLSLVQMVYLVRNLWHIHYFSIGRPNESAFSYDFTVYLLFALLEFMLLSRKILIQVAAKGNTRLSTG